MPSAASKRTRVSFTRVVILLVAIAALGWFGVRAISAAALGPVVPGPSTFSAYVDVTATPSYGFETPSGPAESDGRVGPAGGGHASMTKGPTLSRRAFVRGAVAASAAGLLPACQPPSTGPPDDPSPALQAGLDPWLQPELRRDADLNRMGTAAIRGLREAHGTDAAAGAAAAEALRSLRAANGGILDGGPAGGDGGGRNRGGGPRGGYGVAVT